MAVTIDGTNGITNVNGSATTPAETGTDTDTGIYYGTNTVSLATNGTQRFTIDSSGNVGIGTASPTTALDVSGVTRQTGTLGRYSTFVRGLNASTSTITLDIGGGTDSNSYFVEILISGYAGAYLKYAHTVYMTNNWTSYNATAIQTIASSGVSVAFSTPSSGVLRYVVTMTSTYPIVTARVSGGGTGTPNLTFSLSNT